MSKNIIILLLLLKILISLETDTNTFHKRQPECDIYFSIAAIYSGRTWNSPYGYVGYRNMDNYGNKITRTLLRIDISKMFTNIYLINAKLKLYLYYGSTYGRIMTNNLYKILDKKWYYDKRDGAYYSGGNWENYAKDAPWTIPGLKPGVDYDTNIIDQFTFNSSTDSKIYVELDVSKFYSNVINNKQINNGFLLKMVDDEQFAENFPLSNNYIYISAGDATDTDELPVLLDFTYSKQPELINVNIVQTNNNVICQYTYTNYDKIFEPEVSNEIRWYINTVYKKQFDNYMNIPISYLKKGDICFYKIRSKSKYLWSKEYLSPVIIIEESNNDEVILSTTTFSPNGDGNNDNIYLLLNIKQESNVSIKILDLNSVEINKLYDNTVSGNIILNWDGKDYRGNIVSSGSYLFLVSVNNKNKYYIFNVLR